MKIEFSEHALGDYENLLKTLQRTADKQFDFLLRNFQHPSLHAKKYDEAKNIWQGRITKNYRFYFKIIGDIYFIVRIIKHPK